MGRIFQLEFKGDKYVDDINLASFDCAIIGGGMVGAASALTLAELGLKVALIEQYQPKAFSHSQPFDLRVSAISLASEHLLMQVGAWPQIKQWRSCPYKRLGVWEFDHNYTEFNALDIEQTHLGHIVENRLIQLSLWQQVSLHTNISLYCPDTVESLTQDHEQVVLSLTSTKITSKLVIAADGAQSKIRTMVNIGMTGWDYQQSAMLINVQTDLPPQDITWQQFFPTGPVAMLPMPATEASQGNASLVWYHKRDEIKRLVSLSNNQLQDEVIKSFPRRLGKVKVINKGAFPLTRRHANTYQKGRVLLLGDAAHTINPMAGQGVNIGFKDVKAIQEVIASAIANGEVWHNIDVLARYEKMRRNDNLLMMSTMDALYTVFSHPSPLMRFARNAGLFVANRAPVLKNKALAYACGL